MNAYDQASYRLRLAEGFLGEARQDIGLGRWRSAVDNAQLSVENAAKAALALLGPVGRTHNPALALRQAVKEGRFQRESYEHARELAGQAELLGPDVHVETDYGDETGGRTPWELFDESDARQAITIAEKALQLARELVERTRP